MLSVKLSGYFLYIMIIKSSYVHSFDIYIILDISAVFDERLNLGIISKMSFDILCRCHAMHRDDYDSEIFKKVLNH